METPARKRTWYLALAALAAFAVGATLSVHFLKRPAATSPPVLPVPKINGSVLPVPRALTPFTLVSSDGAPFSPKQFAGHWSFVYFGYTYCPDVCPLTLVELADVKKKLAKALPGLGEQYYFVSVDPARDTPKRMGEYVAYFDPTFHGLTGKGDQIAKFAHQLGAFYLKPSGQDEKSYVVSHSSTIAVLDPDGKFHAVFSSPHEAAQIVADFQKIVRRYRKMARPAS